MSAGDSFRRLRGALGNALVWGAGWSAAAFAVMVTMRLAGAMSDASWLQMFALAVKFGVIGTIAGGAFSAVIGLVYRGRRLSEINWIRFALGGAVVTGVFVPLFLQTMNLLSGDGLVPWALVTDDAVLTAVFGGVAAACSLRLAQWADARVRGRSLDRSEGLERLEGGASVGERDALHNTPAGRLRS